METKKFPCPDCHRTHKSKRQASGCCKHGEIKKEKFNRNKLQKNGY